MQINTNPEHVFNQFLLPAKERILLTINKLNGTSLTEDQVIFTSPIPNLGNHNTKVTIIAKETSDLSGRFDWYYNRTNIESVFGDKNPILQVEQEDNLVSDLLDKFFHKYRIRLTYEDIHDVALPKSNEPFKITLKIRDTSLGWFGSVVLDLIPVQATLSSIVTQNVDNLMNNGEQLDGKTRAEIYYGFKRYTEFKEYGPWLDNPPKVGDLVDSSHIVQLVKSLFGDKWHWTPNSKEDYNLFGSIVTYFNQNVGSMYLDGDPRDLTLAIRLGNHCTNMSGYLLIKFPVFHLTAYQDWLKCLENSELCPKEEEDESEENNQGEDPNEPEETTPDEDAGDETESEEPTNPSDPTEDDDTSSGDQEEEQVDEEDQANDPEETTGDETESEEPVDPSDPTEDDDISSGETTGDETDPDGDETEDQTSAAQP